MPTVSIGHRPDLTAEQVIEIFKRHFGDRYEIIPAPEGTSRKPLSKDFVMKKSALVGVKVFLSQEEDETKLVFDGMAPSPVLDFITTWLFAGLPSLFIFRAIKREVKDFIETCEEFR